MKQNIFYLIISLATVLGVAGCSKKGDAIDEAKIGSYKFTTYTIDTLRFRVVINDIDMGDSLLSPVGLLNTNVSFFDSVGTLKIFDAETNELFIDTSIRLQIGFSTISIVQLSSGQKPFIVPIPNEPPPAAGNYKVRFQYNEPVNSSVPFFDSIQCIIKLSGVLEPVDTIVLSKYELSSFYESTLGVNFKMELHDPVNNDFIDNNTNNLSSTGFTDFNTATVFGSAPGGVAYNFFLQRIY